MCSGSISLKAEVNIVMKSNEIFRWRGAIFFLIFCVGFWAPWERLGGHHPGTAWLFLAAALSSAGVLPIASASIAVMGAAIFCALLAALLRTWATAYLGRSVMQARALHSEHIVADGPFRYVRNPLYLGLWIHSLALAILMPPGGALFAVLAIAATILLLVRTEERFLTAQAGDAYLAYRRRVPRFLPNPLPRVPAGGVHPHWPDAVAGEIYMWGVVLGYAVFAHRYNVTILEQCVLISLGVGVILRGILRPVQILQ